MPTTPSCATVVNLLGMGGQYLGSAVDAFLQALGAAVIIDILPSSSHQSGTGVSAVTILSRPAAAAPQYRCVYLRALPAEDIDTVVGNWAAIADPGNVIKLLDITNPSERALQSEILIIYTASTESAFPVRPEAQIRPVLNSTGATITAGSTGTFVIQGYTGASPGSVTARNISGMDWATGAGGYVAFDILTGEWGALQG